MNNTILIIACLSVICATISICVGAICAAVGESGIAREGIKSITQQPDKADDISKTVFMTMAMVESSAIYCLVISMILIFANPFWTAILQK